MSARTLALLPAALLLLLLGCPSEPPSLEVTGEAAVVDGVEQVRVVAQTRKGEVVQFYPGFEEVEADDEGRAEVVIVPAADELRGPTIYVTATIRVKGGPSIERQIDVPRIARLIHDEVLPKLTSSSGNCGIALEPNLKLRTFGLGGGARITIGGVPMASSEKRLPPRALIDAANSDAVLAGGSQPLLVPVRIVKEGITYDGALQLGRDDLMDALQSLLIEVPGKGVELPTDGSGAALAWAGVSGHWPLKFYGEVSKLGDIGRVAVAETTSTGKRSCGVYGNDRGDTQQQRLDVMRITATVYDVRTGAKLSSKTFQPPARCPDTATRGRSTSVILPPEKDIIDWVKTQ